MVIAYNNAERQRGALNFLLRVETIFEICMELKTAAQRPIQQENYTIGGVFTQPGSNATGRCCWAAHPLWLEYRPNYKTSRRLTCSSPSVTAPRSMKPMAGRSSLASAGGNNMARLS